MRNPKPRPYGKVKWIIADWVENRASNGINGTRSGGQPCPIYEYWTGETWDKYQGASLQFDTEANAQEYIDDNIALLAGAANYY